LYAQGSLINVVVHDRAQMNANWGNQVAAKAPLRLGLAGGGTDVSPFSEEYGGVVVNATISLFARVLITPSQDKYLKIQLSDLGLDFTYPLGEEIPTSGPDRLVAGVYNVLRKEAGKQRELPCNITTWIDVPPGSGLGSSSTLVVTLIGALSSWFGLCFNPYEIAELAFYVEREYLGLAGGKQDQYAAVFGGFNYLEFGPGRRIVVEHLDLPRRVINSLESRMVLTNLGTSRFSSQIINAQIKNVQLKQKKTLEALHFAKLQAISLKNKLLAGDVKEVGKILYEGWQYKKRFAASITNPAIEKLIREILDAGAIGGKISGAGGGGFMMIFVEEKNRYQVIQQLKKRNLDIFPFTFVERGLEIWQ